MSILIATSTKLHYLDNDRKLHSLVPYSFVYGITWDKNQLYLGLRRHPYISEQSIGVFDDQFEFVKRLPTKDLDDIHQIIYHDEKIYITNTRHERVDIVDKDYNQSQLIYTGKPQKGLHLNSVWINDDKIYLVEHRRSAGSRVRILYGYDPATTIRTTRTIDIGKGVHGVYEEDNFLYVCSSERNKILRYDLDTKKTEIVVNFAEFIKGHCRGICRTKDKWYIGMSMTGPKASRHQLKGSAVFVLDNNFEILEHIKLKKTYGQLNELRIVDETDYAHNQIPFPYDIEKFIYDRDHILDDQNELE